MRIVDFVMFYTWLFTVQLRENLGCVSLGKSEIENPNESENGFCVSLLNRSVRDLSHHGGSKEPENPAGSGF